MEELIKQAFIRIDIYSPRVHRGYYDLINSDGDTILPMIWESMVQPGDSITMNMYWPVPETLPPAAPQTQVAVRQPNEVAVAPQNQVAVRQPNEVAVAPKNQVAIESPWSGSLPSAFAKKPYERMRTPTHPYVASCISIPSIKKPKGEEESRSSLANSYVPLPSKQKPEGKMIPPPSSGSDSDHSLPPERRSKLKRSLLKWR
jgi:hypothetical protein